MLEWALVANVDQIDLPGAFLALDRATDSLLLCHRIDANGLDAERLSRLVTGLIEAARLLRNAAGAR
jgi:hypothetical protein